MGRHLGRCAERGEDSAHIKVRGAQLCPHKFWAQDSGLSPGPQGALAGSGPGDSSVPRNLDSPAVKSPEGQAERLCPQLPPVPRWS